MTTRHSGVLVSFSCAAVASVEHTVRTSWARFDHVDYLVNNAGRSIRRSVVNSPTGVHDTSG